MQIGGAFAQLFHLHKNLDAKTTLRFESKDCEKMFENIFLKKYQNFMNKFAQSYRVTGTCQKQIYFKNMNLLQHNET